MNEEHISKPFGLGKGFLLHKLKGTLEKGVSLTQVHYSIEQEEIAPYISERPYYLIGNYPLSVSFEQEVFQFSIEYRMPVELLKRDYGYEAVTDSPVGQIQIRRLRHFMCISLKQKNKGSLKPWKEAYL